MATDTHSECVILHIISFRRQQCLRESASLSHHLYTATFISRMCLYVAFKSPLVSTVQDNIPRSGTAIQRP